MEFGRWYPLREAGDHAPAAPGVLQLKIATGVLDYPRGKSAMVWYELATDVRAAAGALARVHAAADLRCRHLIEIDAATDLAAFYAKLRGDFLQRFGAPPRFPAPPPDP